MEYPVQLSDPVTRKVTMAPHTPGSLSLVMSPGQVIAGTMLSMTVTMAVHVEVFPLTSVTVRVTVFGPALRHVNSFGITDKEATAQLSYEPLLTWAAVTRALPLTSRYT